MTSSVISMRRSFKSECREWYLKRLQLGASPEIATAYVYSWHEEKEPNECKIGYCSKDPFEYLWNGPTLSHQKRLPVIFLSIGARTVGIAKEIEHRMHARLEHKHMPRSCAQEWFLAHRDEVCECARAVVTEMEANGAI